MTRPRTMCITLVGLCLAVVPVAFAAQSGRHATPAYSIYGEPVRATDADGKVTYKPSAAADQILVRFKDRASSGAIASAHGRSRAALLKRFQIVRNLQLVRLPRGSSVDKAIEAYRRHPDVIYAEPNYTVKALGTPNDPFFNQLWGLHNTGQAGGTVDADIDAPQSWDLHTGSGNVVVAVIDTGVDYNHQDLAANIWRNTADCNSNGVDDDGNGQVDDCHGIDTFNSDSNPMDDHDHGTHVAGTIGAVGNNGIGVVGVNWNVRVMACKFLGAAGSGTIADAIDCMEYVKTMKDRGVNIVATNNSWGGGGFSQALYDAIDAHRQRGILFVAAAGNSATDNDAFPFYPAGYYLPNVISVAASDRFNQLSYFSNYGRRSVHLAAPGSEILSTTVGNLYKTFSGTSMAAPHVAGLAALLQAQNPARDWRAIKNLILAGGQPFSAETITQRMLNASGSLSCSNSTVLTRVTPSGDAFDGAIGTPIDLAALHINCSVPNGQVGVQVQPGNQTVVLLDDGIGADLAAGDGMYAGRWTPAEYGDFTLNFPGGDTVAVRIQPGPPDDLFRPYQTWWVGSWPEAVAIGDVNGDGRNDVVMTTSYYFDPENDFHLHVFLQQPWGELAPPVKYPTFGTYQNDPSSVAIGDVNNDGRADVVVGNSGANIAVFLQTVSGGLANPVFYPTVNSLSIKIADLNNDRLNDVVGIGWGTNTAAVLLQNSSRTLNPPITYNVTHGGYDEVDVGDVNNDGLTDVIVMSGQLYVNLNLGVLLQTSVGGLDSPVYYDIAGNELTSGVAVGDIDGNESDDIVVTYGGNRPGSFVGTFLQNDSGTLDPSDAYASYDIPEAVEIADVDGDGLKDIVVLHGGWMAMGVYVQAPDGGLFAEELYGIPYASHYNPQGLDVGDINGDGANDVVIADYNYGLVVLYHSPVAPALAVDLSITNTDSPDPIVMGDSLTYTMVVTNAGPDGASGVVVTDTLPSGVAFVSSSTSQGSCSGTGTVTCNLGSLANGANAKVTIVVRPTAGPTLNNTALVESHETDPNTANNSATATTTVALPTVTVMASDASATEAGPTTGSFAISRSAGTGQPLAINYTLSGTASSGNDYVALTGSVAIPSGASTATVIVTPVDDTLAEGNETITVTLSPSATYAVGSPNSASLTITDNDGGKDLRIENLALSLASVAPGGSTTVSHRVANRGTLTVTETYTDRIYLSTNQTFEPTDVLLGTTHGHTSDLAPNATHSNSKAVTIPVGTAPGDYFILVRADALGAVAESNEGNNVTAVALTVSPGAGKDLRIENLALSLASVAAGSGTTVSHNIVNRGTVTVTETYRERIYLSANETYESTETLLGSTHGHTSDLAPNAVHASSQSFTIPVGTAPGDYFILVRADALGAVAESNEGNNVTASALTVTAAAGGKDLQIENLALSAGSVAPGGNMLVSHNVANRGTVTVTETYKERIYLSANQTFGSADVLLGITHGHTSDLTANAIHANSQSFTIPAGTAPGNYFILVRADTANAVAETNEGNNITAAALIVTGP